MIKGLILDVDGVLIGSKKGFNWPSPHPLIIQTLRSLHEKGLLISLCTGKGTFSIKKIVEDAHLDNVHVGDGGAIVTDFLHNKIIDQHIIDRQKVKKIIGVLLQNRIYTELYTKEGYYIQKDRIGDKTQKHADILYKEPTIVSSLSDISEELDVVKVMPVADDELDKQRIIALYNKARSGLTLQWGVHPTALPYQWGLITENGISKRQAAMVVSKYSGISLSDMLGIGDGMTDWQFMEICGYAGSMGNGSPELKENVITKKDRGYIGSSVDENGLIDILKHFDVFS